MRSAEGRKDRKVIGSDPFPCRASQKQRLDLALGAGSKKEGDLGLEASNLFLEETSSNKKGMGPDRKTSRKERKEYERTGVGGKGP